ncbi:MAG: hypothetical protein WCG60_00200 [bacterium]
MKHIFERIIDIILGAITLTIIVSIFCLFFGNISMLSDFFLVVYLSIICTAGVTLVIWIPLFLGIGRITRKMLIKIFGIKKTEVNTVVNNKLVENIIIKIPSKNELAIIEYITNSRSTGISDTLIHENLKRVGGWSEIEIAEAFKHSAPKA